MLYIEILKSVFLCFILVIAISCGGRYLMISANVDLSVNSYSAPTSTENPCQMAKDNYVKIFMSRTGGLTSSQNPSDVWPITLLDDEVLAAAQRLLEACPTGVPITATDHLVLGHRTLMPYSLPYISNHLCKDPQFNPEPFSYHVDEGELFDYTAITNKCPLSAANEIPPELKLAIEAIKSGMYSFLLSSDSRIRKYCIFPMGDGRTLWGNLSSPNYSYTEFENERGYSFKLMTTHGGDSVQCKLKNTQNTYEGYFKTREKPYQYIEGRIVYRNDFFMTMPDLPETRFTPPEDSIYLTVWHREALLISCEGISPSTDAIAIEAKDVPTDNVFNRNGTVTYQVEWTNLSSPPAN